MEVHEAANIFPLDEKGIDDLAKDIKQNGLLQPIETIDNKIIDGRRRALACEKAGLDPEEHTTEVDPPDPVAYVWSLNVLRRHLTKSQISAALVKREELTKRYKKEAQQRKKTGKGSDGSGGRGKKKTNGTTVPKVSGRAVDQIAKDHGVSGKSIQRTEVVREKGISKVFDALETNQISITSAYKIAKQPKKEQLKLLREELKPTKKPKPEPPAEGPIYRQALDIKATLKQWGRDVEEFDIRLVELHGLLAGRRDIHRGTLKSLYGRLTTLSVSCQRLITRVNLYMD